MGKVAVEEAIKELERMSKRMKRVATLLDSLSHVDGKFEKKADELMSASMTIDDWRENIYKEHMEKEINDKRRVDKIIG